MVGKLFWNVVSVNDWMVRGNNLWSWLGVRDFECAAFDAWFVDWLESLLGGSKINHRPRKLYEYFEWGLMPNVAIVIDEAEVACIVPTTF